MENKLDIFLDYRTWLSVTFFPSRDMLERYGARCISAQNLLDEQEIMHEASQWIGLRTVLDGRPVSEALLGACREGPSALVLWRFAKMAVCGVDNSLVAVSWDRQSVQYRRTIGSVITLFTTDDDERLVSWSVDGISCFNKWMEDVWYWSPPDVASDIKLQGKILEIRAEHDSKLWHLDVSTGRLVKNVT